MTGSATYSNNGCTGTERIPITVTVKNEGAGVARNVFVYGSSTDNGLADYTDDSTTIATILPGETKTVTLQLRFKDNCWTPDNYSATISITPSNGARFEFVKQIKDI